LIPAGFARVMFRIPRAEVDRLRSVAARRALFDPSSEATLARRYEAAAERGFFRALQELRRLDLSVSSASG
jgi:hypothetical protein